MNQLPLWVNKILLEYSHAHSFTCCLWLLWNYNGRISSYGRNHMAQKPKLFTIKPFTEFFKPPYYSMSRNINSKLTWSWHIFLVFLVFFSVFYKCIGLQWVSKGKKRLLTQFNKCCSGSDIFHDEVSLFIKITLFWTHILMSMDWHLMRFKGLVKIILWLDLYFFNASSVLITVCYN